MMPGGIFDRVRKSKAFIWFLIATNFFYFTRLNVLVDGCLRTVNFKINVTIHLLSPAGGED